MTYQELTQYLENNCNHIPSLLQVIEDYMSSNDNDDICLQLLYKALYIINDFEQDSIQHRSKIRQAQLHEWLKFKYFADAIRTNIKDIAIYNYKQELKLNGRKSK